MIPFGRLTILAEKAEQISVRAAGSRIAGGATLVVVADRSTSRQLVRDGVCDFLVSSLEEALRILKNEVRKGTSLSVCLAADPGPVLEECVARGVQPDQIDISHATLLERGARLILWPNELPPGMFWMTLMQAEGSATSFTMAGHWMRDALPAGDMRQLWLQNAPAVLGRRLQRYSACPLDVVEMQRLVQALQQGGSDVTGGLVLLQDSLRVWPGTR